MSYWFSWKNKKGEKVVGTSSGLDSGNENSWLNAIILSVLYSSIFGIGACFVVPRIGLDTFLSIEASFLLFFAIPFAFLLWKLRPSKKKKNDDGNIDS